MATVLDMIKNAMIDIVALAQGETPPTAESTWALSQLNMMIDSWRTRRLYVYYIAKASYPFAVSKQSYTIGRGAGADFVADRPVKIETANLVLSGGERQPLEVFNIEDYASLRIPVLASTPARLYYQPTYPNGTLWPWPYPTDVAQELELFSWMQLASFATVNDAVALPPGYELAMKLSLAEILCPGYGKAIPESLAALARQARANIMSLNSVPPSFSTDFPALQSAGAYFDHLTGNLI